MSNEFSAEFEKLCLPHLNMLKRYLFHKISNHFDAEDILQDVLLAAYKNFGKLKDKSIFKSWIIGIASHKCVDYYKAKAKKLEIPLDETSDCAVDNHGVETAMLVNDTLNLLRDKDKQVLYLFYIKGYNQKDIALKLNIPLGTVKSRISTAKENFKALYPHPPQTEKGEFFMNSEKKVFPKFMPDMKIEKSNEPPFKVKYEEISGWLIIPRVGVKSSFAFYDDPDKRLTGVNTMDCVREAVIHGIPCVQVDVEENEDGEISKQTKFMRLTETHASYVAEMKIQDNSFYFGSFYDDEWLLRYEVGENNIGREIHQEAKAVAVINNDGSITVSKEECADIIGRYNVKIDSRSFDTVAILEICEGIMTILYVDKNGRTVLFRRYNRFNWKTDRYKALWTDKLPDSEVLIVNNEKYVHWYDCISDYVM
jgi:RNA polymerase sigma factor (sigma-70 family)